MIAPLFFGSILFVAQTCKLTLDHVLVDQGGETTAEIRPEHIAEGSVKDKFGVSSIEYSG